MAVSQYNLNNPSSINWATAYGGRFDHLKNNPTRAAEVARQWEASQGITPYGSNNNNNNNNQNQNTSPEWNLSSWNWDGNQFTQQPTLTIDGQQFTYDTPQQYINKMQSAGLTGSNVQTFIGQFQSAMGNNNNNNNQNNNQNNQNVIDNQIDNLYQQYFGRNVLANELDFWRTQSISQLESQLQNDYQNASGHAYDGSPIMPGQNQSQNDLEQGTTTPTGQQATLSSPDGQYKTIVDVGSAEASQLQGAGWTLGDSGASVIDVNQAISNLGNNTQNTNTDNTTGDNTTGDTNTNQQGNQQNQQTSISNINYLYQRFFGRDATMDELNFWATQPLSGLQNQLATDYENASGHPYDGSPIQPNQTQSANDLGYYIDKYGGIQKIEDQNVYTPDPESLQAALDMIDQQYAAGNITLEMAETFKDVVRNYPAGIADDVEQILTTFNKIKENTIDPYYKNEVDMIKSQFQTNIDTLQTQQQMELEKQETDRLQRIKEAQGSLESSGMTFSGKGTELLGQQSATAGVQGEGSVPQYNRMIATSDNARRTQEIMNLGGRIEQQLGTNMGGLNLGGYNPATQGFQGSVAQNQQGAYAGTLNNLIGNYNQSIQSQTQIPYTFNQSL